MRRFVLFIVSLVALGFVQGLNLETLKYCCNLGTNYASSNLKCTSFQTPIAGIQPEDESSCIHSIEVCCRNQNQGKQCAKGIEEAKNGASCSGFSGHEKDCCEACQLGRETGLSQQLCQDNLGLGQTFVDCCKDITESTTTSSTAATSQASPEVLKSTTTPDILKPLPPIENVCDIGDVCAHICIPTQDSYKCDCNKGFSLMADGVSCKPDKRVIGGKKGDRCSTINPCDHDCIDTGVAIKCACREGFELAKDKRSCKDIDECASGVNECTKNEVCVNEEGSYYCEDPNFSEDVDTDELENKCPAGYKLNFENLACDDINECEFEIICPRPKICINTIGSFKCEGEDRPPQCPPGFHFKAAIDTCADIDECITGENDCNKESQVCLNTKGNYTCIDKVSKKTCPPGFKKNPYTQNCDDINECEENDQLCRQNEECVNEPGGHTCVPKKNPKAPYTEQPKVTPETTTATSTSTSPQPSSETPRSSEKPVSCSQGYRYVGATNTCTDIDECQEDQQACDSTQLCYNTRGSYVCSCKTGFTKDFQTGACVDVNECQLGSHECTVAQRCDNTIGSYLCARITGCGTGYTLNYANGLCEDDDECILGTHGCRDYGYDYKCRNTLGSYRCEHVRPQLSTPRVQLPTSTVSLPTSPRVQFPTSRMPAPTKIYTPPTVPTRPQTPPPLSRTTTQSYPIISGTLKKCLPGYIMNERGQCEDINECTSNPCLRGQKCLNFNGRYQCISALQCKVGYELDDSGESCVDVNECTRGIHKCNYTQICKNGQGYYVCECPPGHHLNPTTHLCEDIDECKYYRVCSVNAECINTIGSYKCRCKEGFRESGNSGNFCQDIDECKESSRLCEQTCVNIWGSYRCACRPGFTLNFDNRTCTDIDECDKFKDKRLCIGNCENIPGSYRCQCPRGYRLGSDKRTCIDIDECEQNICSRPDDVCLNTRGSHKCFTITCPDNYIRDPAHKGRCKRPQTLCDPRDLQCILMPEQYTYHYITLVSNLPVSDGNIQFFQINGPKWTITRAEFSMKVVNVNCPQDVERVTERYFKMVKPEYNIMQLYLVRSIMGPQEIELKVEMQLYQGNVLTANVVSQIYIVVSEYPF